MRTPEEVLTRVRTRVADRWPATIWSEVAGPADPPTPDLAEPTSESPTSGWPHTVPLGRASSADLGANFSTVLSAVHDWRAWAAKHQVELIEAKRRVAGTDHLIPANVVIPTIDEAARLAGDTWPPLLARARQRAAQIRDQHPVTTDPVRALRAAAQLDDVDFDIASRAAAWFARRAATAAADDETPEALTPRQVPIEGVHAKWLNHHHALVRNLAGLHDLHLTVGHPPRIHFTYLDPDHLERGRRHDSYSVGDREFTLPYEPQFIVISENKDTAVGFPPIPGGIAVEGGGTGGGTIAATPWIRDAPLVIYWGDLDVDGLRILNEFRAAGVNAQSILMDLPTYQLYASYGTNTDRNDQPIKHRPGPDPGHLTAAERELYDHLIGADADVKRVEQERIPLIAAAQQVVRCLRGPTSSTSPSTPAGPPTSRPS